ncbi:hypothetical protein EDD18DRAFT_1160994 [Armillaria luteobubalina]|uniref:Uncharacterized protein n=1 Tax=Armillaria luteobubalina TaxID=153913 RepID=A0AA39UTW2_9AGAR|nr:hypothetical protein EDD18DRAFT_1160994 [Armillaria luteobubalina]
MPTDSQSLFQIFRRSKRRFLLQCVLFCCSTATVLGGYRSNSVFVTILGVLTATITFVATVAEVVHKKTRPSSHDRDIETRLRVLEGRSTSVHSVRVRSPANSTAIQQASQEFDRDTSARWVATISRRSRTPPNSTDRKREQKAYR